MSQRSVSRYQIFSHSGVQHFNEFGHDDTIVQGVRKSMVIKKLVYIKALLREDGQDVFDACEESSYSKIPFRNLDADRGVAPVQACGTL